MLYLKRFYKGFFMDFVRFIKYFELSQRYTGAEEAGAWNF